MKKYQSFLSENFQFMEVKFSIYLNRRVFVMTFQVCQVDKYQDLLSLKNEKKKKKKKKKNQNVVSCSCD